MWRSLNGVVLLLVGALIGSIGFPHSGAARQYRLQKGRGFWLDADEQSKTAYLLGYLDSETIYRSSIDLSLKARCTDSGKQWIDDFEYKFPLLDVPLTIADLQKGLDDFYKDDRNPMGMFPAQRIVRLGLVGRPQSEIDDAKREASDGTPR
jgi:hypothetical protein